MKGCRGICSLVECGRPFGAPYKTHALCRRCDVWMRKTSLKNNNCPCCGKQPRLTPRHNIEHVRI